MAKIKLEIISPNKVVYSADIDMLIVRSIGGDLGILPKHAPLLAGLLPHAMKALIDGTEKRGDYVVTEWLYNGIRQPSHMIVDGRWKLFLNYSTESKVVPVLYNLDEDPYEMHNLIGQSEPDREKYLAKAESLKLKMIEWLRSRNSVYADRIAEVKL